MSLIARSLTAAFGLAMVVYPLALHATPVVAALTVVAAVLAALAVVYPRRLSGGPAVLVLAVAYVAAVAARGEVDLLAPLPAGSAFLFVQGVSVCGLLATGADVERNVLVRRARSSFAIAVGGGLAGVTALGLGAATGGSSPLAFLVAVGACGLLLMVVGASRPASRPAPSEPKGQDVP